jgi:hypothetical protein
MASQAFTKAFTLKYAELAAKEPVYAQLRNLIDMAIAAAFIQQHDYYGRIGWEMPVFGSEERFPVETYPEAKQVESAVNVVWKGNTLMTPIGGGVQIQPALALSEGALLEDEQGNVAKLRQEIDIQQIDLSDLLFVACDANGVGSRFRATTNHMEDATSENDSRPPCARRDTSSFAGPEAYTPVHLAACYTSGNSYPARRGRQSSAVAWSSPSIVSCSPCQATERL